MIQDTFNECRKRQPESNEALAIAATKFDPSMGYRFITYAGHWVREKVKREALDRCRTVRVPAREALKAWQAGSPYPVHSQSLDTTLDDDSGGSVTYLSDLLGAVTENEGETSAVAEALLARVMLLLARVRSEAAPAEHHPSGSN